MENIIIDDNNINKHKVKISLPYVRAVLFYNDNVLVEKNCDGSIILPGTVVNCPAKEYLIKDLSKKLGYDMMESDLTKFLFLDHYCNGVIFDDSLIETDYYYGRYKGIDFTKTLKNNINLLKLINIDELIEMTSISYEDEGVNFSNKETHEALKVFKKIKNR